MMAHMAAQSFDLATMPRGGYGASCLDRWLQTDRTEYLHRAPGTGAGTKKRQVRCAWRTLGALLGARERLTALVLAEIAEDPDPAVLVLGGDTAGWAAQLLVEHPTATLTVADPDPAALEVTERFDLAVFALGLHRLAPPAAAAVLAAGTRVATRLLIVDLPRPPAPLHLMAVAALAPWAPLVPAVHDTLIGSLRAYSPAAITALAADAGVEVATRSSAGVQIAVARRGAGARVVSNP